MKKAKKKLTSAQKKARKAARAERQRKYESVFINGRQVRVKRPPTVDGIPVDQFIERKADPLWLHQNELWELMPDEGCGTQAPDSPAKSDVVEEDIPF